jgi:hypothetical protein
MKLGFENESRPDGTETPRRYWIQVGGRKISVPRWLYRIFDPKN